ncbi:Uma2 family endonuclease [Limnoraphis robusta]|uniref:Uma2 family endonuclease n=1 Tax=Limnoraphis robusta CCNP1315 TaxID=3110306 RepID=A0ABU5U690_9CYAN|nr:Uma2 family endonuclease [Limnoraphis robusta]MEA5498110.1 Uma2 family endonuclease [Limnoraphis robusta BA-68 BA1]MEA5522674.1 Uma2 family endonuclease [Limnoraphis robusta CCNP1315]MEA5547547.1 Uma2 family endonuclease [Limnoraphis robusta CCNP1324]
MTLSTVKWSLEDYHQMIKTGLLDDRPVELLSGEIVQMSPEGEPHAFFSSEAGHYLTRVLGDRALIRHAKPITLPNQSEPEPDIAIVEPLGREYLTHHPYPENIFWVIEYANTSLEKDSTVKYHIYAEAGIPEYWLVNLQTGELIVYRQPSGREYGTKMTLKEGNISPVAFPDVTIPVEAMISI